MSAAKLHSIGKPTKVPKDTPDGLEMICDALPVLIAHVDAKERYCFNNRAYESWFDLRPQKLQGRAMQEVLGETAYAQMQPRFKAALGGARQAFESAIRRNDGNERTVHINYVPRLNSAKEVDGIYILMIDITDRQTTEEAIMMVNSELERRVEERTAQLQAANQELEAFCYSVSHDLRAPLRAVRGFTEVLMQQHAAQLDASGQDFLNRVNEAGDQMDHLVEDLLRLSRVSRSEIHRNEIDLSRMAEEIFAELKKEEPREVKLKINPKLRTRGDERLIRLALDNLLRNAWKFTGKQPQAVIEFDQRQEPDAAFYVRDDGVGFDMTYADRLFGVFQRLHSSKEFPGSGLGLAIVQRVINRHGGKVWAEGTSNAGATFYFTLPNHR